jgi:transcriptional regulator with XRE-family HTH domain
LSAQTVVPLGAEHLAKNLQRLLDERGMKPIQLADKAPMSRGQLCRILQGQSFPSIKSLERLAHVLGVPPGTLLDGEADDELVLNSSIRVALRSFKKLTDEDQKHLTWIIHRFAQNAGNHA